MTKKGLLQIRSGEETSILKVFIVQAPTNFQATYSLGPDLKKKPKILSQKYNYSECSCKLGNSA